MNKWMVVVGVVMVGCTPGSGSGLLTFDDIASGCAAIRSCLYGSSDFPSCVGSPSARPLPAEFACFARVHGDCHAALECIAKTLTPGASCPEAGSVCEGNVVVGCEPAFPGIESYGYRIDCGARGLLCLPLSTGGVACGRPCTETCVGSDVVECHEVGEVYVCPAGSECDGGICAAQGPPCTDRRCEGDDLVDCSGLAFESGREYEPISCASWGAHCGYEGGSARCISDGEACDPGAPDLRCEGESLVFCGQDGGVHSFDCTAHGYLGCSGGTRPYCVPRNPTLPEL